MHDIVTFLRNHAYDLTQILSRCPDTPTNTQLERLSSKLMQKAGELEKGLTVPNKPA